YYRNFVSDLIYPPDVSATDVRSYFDAFDGVAEEPTGSWLTYNKQKLAATSWYLDGTLQLQGFYAGRTIRGSQYSYFLTSTRRRRGVADGCRVFSGAGDGCTGLPKQPMATRRYWQSSASGVQPGRRSVRVASI